MSQQDFLSNQSIIIDNGSSMIKAGLASKDQPTCEIRTYTGLLKYDRVMSNDFAPNNNMWIGSELQQRRGLCHLEYPIRHGIIEDWDMMVQIWEYIYDKPQLGVNSREHPVLLSQSAISPNKQSEQMAEIFFEQFNAPAISIVPQSLLSLYASGRGTGIVVDIGDGVSTYFPVYDGFALTPHIHRVDLGGREMTSYLQLLLRRSGYIFSTTSEFEVVREMKESCSECYTTETSNALNNTFIDYMLPDGQVVKLKEERAMCTEVLFNPSLIGCEAPGVPSLITQTIQSCDLELRKELYSNILLSGGATMTRNFGKRVIEDLKTLSPPNTKVRMFAPPNRANAAWCGGSMISLTGAFKSMWVTKSEYKEQGVQCLQKKSLI